MATLHVIEFERLAEDSTGREMAIAMEPPLVEQTVSYTTSTQSAAFSANTRFIYIQSDGAKAYFKTGPSPTATVGSNLLVADDGRFVGIPAGQSFKIACYDGSS